MYYVVLLTIKLTIRLHHKFAIVAFRGTVPVPVGF